MEKLEKLKNELIEIQNLKNLLSSMSLSVASSEAPSPAGFCNKNKITISA